jgi:adenylate cyclase
VRLSGAARGTREIAKQLGTRYLVEGTVRRAHGHIRVSAQLIDGRMDMRLWGEHYDRELKDVFAIENDVAEQIVAHLKGKLSPEEKQAIEEPPRQ